MLLSHRNAVAIVPLPGVRLPQDSSCTPACVILVCKESCTPIVGTHPGSSRVRNDMAVHPVKPKNSFSHVMVCCVACCVAWVLMTMAVAVWRCLEVFVAVVALDKKWAIHQNP